MNIAALFVTWNSVVFIDDSIGRLVKIFPSEDIIVVDNGSSDGTVEAVRTKYPGVRLHTLPVNTGFSGGNNYGLRIAMKDRYDAVCLLNIDTIIEEDFIAPCSRLLEAAPSIGIIGPTVLEATPENIIQCEGGRIRAWTLDFSYRRQGETYIREDKWVEVGYVLGAAMIIRRKVIESIGILDEDYFPAYVEETDFCYRAKMAGYASVVYKGSSIKHIGGQSAGSRQKAFNRISTHRYLFALKFMNPLMFFTGAMAITARAVYWKSRSLMFERFR